MNRRLIFFNLLLFFGCISIYASDTLSFVSPVDHDVKLSGNFMELRKNHFHTGIDIKSSNGKTGDIIRSVADGFVSRVKVQAGGYGQVLYIDHPNGMTSVYAHLQAFNKDIMDWVEGMQYKIESYEIDVYLPDSLFLVKAGDLIGIMGNTGRSFGPHLHFELRDTESEKPLNPEHYNFAPKDDIRPELLSFHVYHLDDNDIVIDHEVRYFKSNGPQYDLHVNTLEAKTGRIAFGIQCFDRINGSSNKNGINSIELIQDTIISYKWKAENYGFHESRKINGFIDYKRKQQHNQTVYRLFKPHCGSLDFFEAMNTGNGIIELEEGESKKIKIRVVDHQGNDVELKFDLKAVKSEKPLQQNTPLVCDSLLQFKSGMFTIDLKPNTFFGNLPQLIMTTGQEQVMNHNCHKVDFGSSDYPILKYYKVSCPAPKRDADKYTFIQKDYKGRWVHYGAEIDSGRLVAHLDQLGEIYLFKDIEAPVIEALSVDKNLVSPWVFRISDNLIPDGRVPNLKYKATINGKWVRCAYDLKTNTLTFKDFDRIPQGDFVFVLKVIDDQQNVTDFELRSIKS